MEFSEEWRRNALRRAGRGVARRGEAWRGGVRPRPCNPPVFHRYELVGQLEANSRFLGSPLLGVNLTTSFSGQNKCVPSAIRSAVAPGCTSPLHHCTARTAFLSLSRPLISRPSIICRYGQRLWSIFHAKVWQLSRGGGLLHPVLAWTDGRTGCGPQRALTGRRTGSRPSVAVTRVRG